MRRAAGARAKGLQQSQRRNADHGAFHGARDGAGIDDVLAGIGAAIDAGKIRSGPLPFNTMARAMITQSVGVPGTAKRRSAIRAGAAGR